MPKNEDNKLAPRGDVSGLAAIRVFSNALETAMIERYIGNAPTLGEIRKIVRRAIKKIGSIKPALMSNCYPDSVHQPNCKCVESI